MYAQMSTEEYSFFLNSSINGTLVTDEKLPIYQGLVLVFHNKQTNVCGHG